MQVTVDFQGSRQPPDRRVDLAEVIEENLEARRLAAGISSEKIVAMLERFSDRLMANEGKLRDRYPASGVPFIAQWCRRAQIGSLLRLAFENTAVLDGFCAAPARADRKLRAYPRGLVVHWMAGNVPTLGFLSLVQALITKNANIIKVASNSDGFLGDLLQELTEVATGEDEISLLQSIAVIRYERKEQDKGEFLSTRADVRIIWGGDEAVEKIRSLPAKPEVQDVIFSNKTSMILLGSEALTGDLADLTRRIALDVSAFEQKACASPHTVFIETDADSVLEAFAEALKEALKNALRTHPKTAPSVTERNAVLNLRAEYDIFHRAWYSEGIEYTLLTDDEFKIGPPIGNRTLFLRKAPDLMAVADLVTPKVQTVGVAGSETEIAKLTEAFGMKGVQRFVKAGTMTHFEVPWDGYLIPQLLVRWTSRARLEKS